jgi:hypothetical protein
MNHQRLKDMPNANDKTALARIVPHDKSLSLPRVNPSSSDDAIAKDKNVLRLVSCRLAHNNPQAWLRPESALKDG